MVRTLLIILLVAAFLLLAATFTWLNPGTMRLDVAFAAIEAPIFLVLAIVFAIGWLFGLLSCSFFILRLLHERRQMRRSVQLAEREVSNLRSLPIQDAG